MVAQCQPEGYRLQVCRDEVRQEDDWWYVVVRPDSDDVRVHQYAEKLAEIEEKLIEEQGLHVLLVPMIVED